MQGYINAPKAPLASNFRPIQPLNQRILRTNIDFKKNAKSQVNSKNSTWRREREREMSLLSGRVEESIWPLNPPEGLTATKQLVCLSWVHVELVREKWERARAREKRRGKSKKQRGNRFVYAFAEASSSRSRACELEINQHRQSSGLHSHHFLSLTLSSFIRSFRTRENSVLLCLRVASTNVSYCHSLLLSHYIFFLPLLSVNPRHKETRT